jgi:phosphatidylinositol alpha-1,6-mannosyltransferase
MRISRCSIDREAGCDDVMTDAAPRSVLLTPNVLGADGVSSLSREIVRALPEPSLVLSLHDEPGGPGALPAHAELRGASGRRTRFLAAVARASLHGSSATDIVCSHLHLAPAATLLAWRGGRITIVLCGIEAWVPLRTLERRALEQSALVAISQHTVDRFKKANPAFASTEVTVCHPGLPAETSRRAANSHAVEPIALIVARMSSDERYKGHDALLDIWSGVLDRRPDARLVVAGDGDDRRRLELRAASLGLEHAVRFVGRVSDAALGELYAQCRVFVMPSRDEGFGLVFLEAMRAGKPCIGSCGAAAEIIQHDVTGLIVDPGSRDELAGALLRVFNEPDTACRFGAAGLERFLSTFTDAHFRARFTRAMEHHRLPVGVPAS